MDEFVAFLFLTFIIVSLSMNVKFITSTNLDNDKWECTQSIFVNKILPHKEVCTQYTKKVQP